MKPLSSLTCPLVLSQIISIAAEFTARQYSSDDYRSASQSSPFHYERESLSLGSDPYASGLAGYGVPPSPRCWTTALQLLQPPSPEFSMSNNNPQEICQRMGVDDQKFLALEIARCHMADLAKPLFHNSAGDNCQHPAEDSDNLYGCLRHLSDSGTQAYTHYISHVQILCTRLTQELLLQQQHNSQQTLADRYLNLTNTSYQHMETINEMALQHTSQLQALARIPKQIEEQLVLALNDQLMNTIQSQVQEQLASELKTQLESQLSDLLKKQATDQSKVLDQLTKHMQRQQQAQEKEYEQMAQRHLNLLNDQTNHLQRHQSELSKQEELMRLLTSSVQTTTQKLGPLKMIDTWVDRAQQGYVGVVLLVRLVLTWFVVRLVTYSQRCRGLRTFFLVLSVLEGATQVGLHFLERHGTMAAHERILVGIFARDAALVVAGASLVISFVSSFFRSTPVDQHNINYDQIVHTQQNRISAEHQLQAIQVVPTRNYVTRPYPQTRSGSQVGTRGPDVISTFPQSRGTRNASGAARLDETEHFIPRPPQYDPSIPAYTMQDVSDHGFYEAPVTYVPGTLHSAQQASLSDDTESEGAVSAAIVSPGQPLSYHEEVDEDVEYMSESETIPVSRKRTRAREVGAVSPRKVARRISDPKNKRQRTNRG